MNQILKKLTPILYAVAAIAILAGIALLAFLVPNAASTFYRVCFVLIALLCLIFGLGVLFLLYISRDTDPNFFLYDTKSARNIDASELTFERVNSRMAYFMTTLTTSQDRLWSDNVLNANPDRFGVNEVYKPLAAYKMLYDLAVQDQPENWRLFLTASPATIEAITAALAKSGEDDMLAKIRYAYDNAADRDDVEWVRDYIMKNMRYIQHRMLGYARRNLEWFY